SRQELFHLVKVNGIRSFDELVARHGKGKGCDICKPAVASILASCWHEMILKPRHAPLQDTNDHFLANLQKDGTYSIVPRVPGGEITPDKLIVLGEVAKRYGLYTKITGAQRIDLFGARVEQLPLIWQELINAGFESGHAYGKALRTVKSCVCGNGGMKPRHADLLATELDNARLIQYIDRFLMFYIRTGDRLQRTSVWLENLEGGIDYLRQVVCEDSLGIGAELEADMQRHVESYECEWKKAIETPEILKRFRHFVNSDAPDRNVIFVAERGQVRPARPEAKELEPA